MWKTGNVMWKTSPENHSQPRFGIPNEIFGFILLYDVSIRAAMEVRYHARIGMRNRDAQ